MDKQQFFSDIEAAAILKIHVRTVRRLIQSGKLPASDLGTGRHHLYRIKASDLENLPKAIGPDLTPRRRRRRDRPNSEPESGPVWP